MNSSQKLGLFILIAITVFYVYVSFFRNAEIKLNLPKKEIEFHQEEFVPQADLKEENKNKDGILSEIQKEQNVQVYFSNSNGKIKSVNRKCNLAEEKSCFSYAIRELVYGPSDWEKSKGYTSEIPINTKILSIREGKGSVMIDLSSNFESGGGAESTYVRVKQLIATSIANSKLPVFLYINGKQANVIGGEGIMIKQPLNERSLDD